MRLLTVLEEIFCARSPTVDLMSAENRPATTGRISVRGC
jgi:hypothetical protein